MPSKWADFMESPDYRLVDLGRPAVFLIPAWKLNRGNVSRDPKSGTVKEVLACFLSKNFGAYTVSSIPNFGCWHDGEIMVMDECVQYEVSFVGKEKIPMLLKELARIASVIDEKCIYIKAGQYSALVYPSDK